MVLPTAAASGGLMGHLSSLFHNANATPPPHSIADITSRLTTLSIHKDDAKLLAKQDIDGDCLQYVTEESLARIGVPTFGRRVKVLKAVEQILAEWAQAVIAGGANVAAAAVTEKRSAAVQPPLSPAVKNGKRSAVDEEDEEPASAKPAQKKKDETEKEKEKDKAKTSNSKEKEKEKEKDSKSTASKPPKSPQPHRDDDEEDEPRSAAPNKADSKRPNTAASKDDKSKLSASGKVNVSSKRSVADSDDEEKSEDEVEPEEVDSDTDRERVRKPAASAAAPAAKAAKKSGDDEDDLFATADTAHASEFMAVRPWLGAIVAPSKAPKADSSPPDAHLKLDWVHGYRSFDSRSNLYYNQSGDVVYPVAAVVVVYSSKTKRQRHFLGHNDDIRCLAQHPTNANLFVSGQNATVVKGKSVACYACVFDSTDFTKQWVLKMGKEDRNVRSACFTGCGKYVVTVSDDDNHTVKVWEWESGKCLASAKGDANPIYLIRANHKDKTELVTVGKRHAMFWQWDSSANKLTGKRASSGGQQLSFYSVAFSEKGYACLGCEDGSVQVFAGGKPAKSFANIHNGKVLSVDYYAGGIVTGGSDCVVNVLDKRMEVSKKYTMKEKVSSVHIRDDDLLIGTMGAEVYAMRGYAESSAEDAEGMEMVTAGHSDGELWALAVCKDGKSYVTVGEDNEIAVWDVMTHRCLRRSIISDKKGKKPKILQASTTSTHPVNQCARAIDVSPNNKHVIIGQNTGEVSVYDLKSLKLVTSVNLNPHGKKQVKEQHDNWIQCLSYSPSGHAVAVGTHGSVVCILDAATDYEVKGVLKASNSFISHLDWSDDGHYLQTNDGAYELLFYSIDEDDLTQTKQITSATSMRDTHWATQTCTLSWSTQGIYDPSQNGQEIHTCHVSGDGALCVSGDDRGAVNLFRYPVLKGGKSNSAQCHSSHVTTVRFAVDDKYVLSTGGHDLAIMQWLIVH